MATRRNTGPALAVLAAVTAVALVAVVAWALTSRSSDVVPSSGSRPYLVVVDGWSWAMRGDRELYVEVDGARVDATFEPADAAALDELLGADPGAVATLLARQLVADPSLECTPDGCTTSSGPVDHRQLADPDSAVLDAQGVQTGAWVAQVRADPDQAVTVSLDGVASTSPAAPELPTPTVADTPAGAILPAPPPAADPSTADSTVPLGPDELDAARREIERILGGPATGGPDPSSPVPRTGADSPDGLAPPVRQFASTDPPAPPDTEPPGTSVFEIPAEDAPAADGTRVLAVGVAFGQVFDLVIPWFAPADEPPSATAFGSPRADLEPAAGTDVPAAPFRAGLSVDDPAAATLTPSQLTMWSSPSVGCGISVVCAATADGVEAPAGEPQVADMCLAATSGLLQPGQVAPRDDGLGTVEVPVKVVLRDSTYRFDGTARAQLGNWPEDTPVPSNSPWPVPVPVSTSPFGLAVRSVEVHDGLGLLTILGSQAPSLDGPFDPASVRDASGGLLVECTTPPQLPAPTGP